MSDALTTRLLSHHTETSTVMNDMRRWLGTCSDGLIDVG